MFKIKSDDILKEDKIEEWIIEYHTFIDWFMELGRITSLVLMMLAGFLNNITYFKIILLIVTISIPVYAKIMYKAETAK